MLTIILLIFFMIYALIDEIRIRRIEKELIEIKTKISKGED